MAETVLGKRQVEIAEGRFLDRKSIRRVRFDDFAVEYQEYSRANAPWSSPGFALAMSHILAGWTLCR